MNIAARYNRLGIKCFNKKEYLRAVYWFKNASALAPNESGYFYNIGNTYCRLVIERGSDCQEDAVRYLSMAANLNHGTASYVLGNIFNPDVWPVFRMKSVERALRCYEKALKNISPDRALMGSILNNLGCCCGKTGRLAEAAAYCRLASERGLPAAKANYETYIAQIPEAWRPIIESVGDADEIPPTVRKLRYISASRRTGTLSGSLDELLAELNHLVGLKNVKHDVTSLINLLRIRMEREVRGLRSMPVSLHLVFSGNPGTGKTTVARLLAQIYHELGVLSKGQLVEVDRSGLVAGYVGQTAIKTQEKIEEARGGILFIDEAYALAKKEGSDFGHEAIDTLLKAMEENREDMIVIVAGYPDLMEKFLDSNPGLRSRFNKFIHFEDYTPEEMFKIFENMCEDTGYTISEGAAARARDYFEACCAKKGKNFANGRDVRNYFEQTVVNQSNRLAVNLDISDEELVRIEEDDLPQKLPLR